MAIFGRADFDLSLITQVIQVDTSNEDELKRFWVRCATISELTNIKSNMSSLMSSLDVDPEMIDDDGYAFHEGEVYVPLLRFEEINLIQDVIQQRADAVFSETDKNFEHIGAEAIERFRHTCQIVQNLVWPLCDRQAVSTEMLGYLRKISDADRRIVFDYTKVPYDDQWYGGSEMPPVELPLSAFVPGSAQGTYLPERFVVQEMEEALLNLWRKKASLRRCEECQYPFLAMRSDHRLCSHRCTNRVSQRNNYHKKKQQ